jgi:thiol-disulfide isomerase/thioredoxin
MAKTAAFRRKIANSVGAGAFALAAGMLAGALFAGGAGDGSRVSFPDAGKFVRLATPQRVPDLLFTDAEGKTRRLSEWRGRTVVLNLWATWCAPCKMEMPSLDRLEGMLGGGNLSVIALSLDRGGMKEPAAFFARQGISQLKLYNDASGEAGLRLAAAGLPLTVVLNEKGEEIARFLGPAEWDAPERISELGALLRQTTTLR